MGVFSDTYEEFKKASPAEKIFIVGGGIGVLAIALYIRKQSSQTGGPVQGATGAGLSGGAGGGGGIQTVPGPNSSQVPILPAGLTPLFDAMGNLIGYQPTSPAAPAPTPTPGGGTNTITHQLGTIWILPGSSKWQTVGGDIGNPLIPYGTGGVPGVTGAHYTYGGQNYTISAGAGGRIWGVPGNYTAQQLKSYQGASVLLYAPKSYYHTATVPQGGGPYGTNVLGVHRGRIAPTREGGRTQFIPSKTLVVANYNHRNKIN